MDPLSGHRSACLSGLSAEVILFRCQTLFLVNVLASTQKERTAIPFFSFSFQKGFLCLFEVCSSWVTAIWKFVFVWVRKPNTSWARVGVPFYNFHIMFREHPALYCSWVTAISKVGFVYVRQQNTSCARAGGFLYNLYRMLREHWVRLFSCKGRYSDCWKCRCIHFLTEHARATSFAQAAKRMMRRKNGLA